jgi:deoxyribonuclease V
MRIDINLMNDRFYSSDENVLNDIQNELKEKISLENNFNIDDIKTIAGVDLAYWQKDGKEYAVCCIVVIDYIIHKIIEKKYFSGEIKFPYIAGYLSFRELPLIIKTAELLENTPDIFVFDGNGYLHPRHMGIAAFASFFLNRPSLGVAKTYYRVNNTDFIMPENNAGAYTDIIIDGETYGRALRTADNIKPVFVSCGNNIDLNTATNIIMNMTDKAESHIPIPTRFADLETHIMREKIKISEEHI